VAQLPIGRFLSHLPTRKVLTINQVFEILVKWVETRDWEVSLYAVIPKRKFQDGVAHEDPTAAGIENTAVEEPAL
jgi:tRNA (guanine9-N1)-methyltransferase